MNIEDNTFTTYFFSRKQAMMKTNVIKIIRNIHFKTEILYIKSM